MSINGSNRSPNWSLPVWEEWIEIVGSHSVYCVVTSLPVWEEWIEILTAVVFRRLCTSLPVWEEWIEISLDQKS